MVARNSRLGKKLKMMYREKIERGKGKRKKIALKKLGKRQG